MNPKPFPFDPRQLYVGMHRDGVYYELQFLYLAAQGYVAKVLKPDHLAGASISGYHISYFAYPWLWGYVYNRRRPTFRLLESVRNAIVEGRFEYDLDERMLRPWFV